MQATPLLFLSKFVSKHEVYCCCSNESPPVFWVINIKCNAVIDIYFSNLISKCIEGKCTAMQISGFYISQ